MSAPSPFIDLAGLPIASRLGASLGLAPEARAELEAAFQQTFQALASHGDSARFQAALGELSRDSADEDTIVQALKELGPWKKGPHLIRGITVDAEWDCRMKWARVLELGLELQGRTVLDVGAGNGFYLRQMIASGARWALGVEPSVPYLFQFLATELSRPEPQMALLSARAENLPSSFPRFDVVFSMGVLYHVRSPIDHLMALKNRLRPGGELVLESLVVPGDATTVLVPRHRYANMRNVWFIPSAELLALWLERVGFELIELGSPIPTTSDEQRSTAFSPGPSLSEALNRERPSLTVEGYPAPTRLLAHARRA